MKIQLKKLQLVWLLLLIGKAYATEELLAKKDNTYIQVEITYTKDNSSTKYCYNIFVHKNTPIKRLLPKIKEKIKSEIGKNNNLLLTSIGFQKEVEGEFLLEHFTPIELSSLEEEDTPQSLIKKNKIKLEEGSVFTDKKLLMFNNNKTIIVTQEKVITVAYFIQETIEKASKGRIGIGWVFLLICIALCTGALIESEIQLLQDQPSSEYNPYYNLLDIIDEEDY